MCVGLHQAIFLYPFKCKRGRRLSNTIICHGQDERGKNRQKSRDQSLTSSILITLNPPHFPSPPALFEEPVILKSGSLGCQVSLRQQQVRCSFQPLGISRRSRYRLLPVFQRCAGAFCRPFETDVSASPCRRGDAQMCLCVCNYGKKQRSLPQMWHIFLILCLTVPCNLVLFVFFLHRCLFNFWISTTKLDSFPLIFYKWQTRRCN